MWLGTKDDVEESLEADCFPTRKMSVKYSVADIFIYAGIERLHVSNASYVILDFYQRGSGDFVAQPSSHA